MKSITFSIMALWHFAAWAQQSPSGKLVSEGAVMHDAKNYEGAISKYREAIKIDPSYAAAYYEMALSYSMLDQADSVLKYADRTIQLNKYADNATLLKKNVIAHKMILEGIALHDQGKYPEAIAKYRESIKVVPRENAFYETAFTYITMKSYDSALRYADLCISLDGETASDAKELKKQAIKYNTNQLIKEGIELQDKGLLMDAVKKYREALTFLDAHYETTLKTTVLSYLNKPGRLIPFADQLLKGNTVQEPDAIVLKGFLLGRNALLDKSAEEVFTDGVTRFPNSVNLRFEQGIFYTRSLNVSKADEIFASLLPTLSSSPDFHFAYSGDFSVNAYYPSLYFLIMENNTARSSVIIQSMDPTHGLFPLSSSGYTATDLKKGIESFFSQWNPGVEKEFMSKKTSGNKDGTSDQMQSIYQYYVKFFTMLDKAGNREAFTYHVLKSLNDRETDKWINTHTKEMKKFYMWLRVTGRDEFKKL